MMYFKAKIVNGKPVLYDARHIDQSTLNPGCLLIQIDGAEACQKCENLNKPRKCGGMDLREKYGVPAPVKKKINPSRCRCDLSGTKDCEINQDYTYCPLK